MLGYAGDEEATSAVISGGWLRTGDLGKLDRKGQLTIVGRAKDVVVASSGENVYPDDVEARLGKLEHVQELTVLGVPDGRGGERLACVAIPETTEDVPRAQRHERTRAALDAALLKLPNVVVTPHVASRTYESVVRQATTAVKNLILAMNGEKPIAQVNPEVPVKKVV